MNPLSEIKESIQKMASKGGAGTVFTAKVKSVQANTTCTVDLDGLTVSDVRLRAVVNGETSKILVTPKTGSYVLVADLSGDLSQLAVVGYSEVKQIEVDTDKIIFNGGENKGLVKIEKLQRNLDTLKNYVLALTSAVATGLGAVGVAEDANGGTGATAFSNAMTGRSINFEDMEDTKITH